MTGCIFLETVVFENPGGWTVDTQCVEAMGSAYLLAHGIGKPVADAVTGFSTEEDAAWQVMVRTRDWTAEWKRGTPAGRFQVIIDDTVFPQELGTNGPEWDWQCAGSIFLNSGRHKLALHDLTGFDGRCDAVCLIRENADVPPKHGRELAEFRRKVCRTVIEDDPEHYDLVVCGGGYAGICTALAAKHRKLKTLLINDRPVLGGCGSSEVRVWAGGKTHLTPYEKLGDPALMISPLAGHPGMKKKAAFFEDDRKTVLFNEGEDLLLNEILIGAECSGTEPRRITAVITKNVRTGKETRRKAEVFSDCTGDAVLARLAGCRVMYGREAKNDFDESLAPETADRLVMGHSTLWETTLRREEVPFPDIDWGIPFDEDRAIRRFNCCWDWETGQYRDQIMDIEYIRDYGLMTCFANWSYLKNRAHDREKWKNYDLEWISAIGGKRESCRVVGDLILSQNDVEQKISYPDATASLSWSIDLHYPDPENEDQFGEPFLSCAYHRGIGKVYPVPYRCLCAKDVENLFLGGRCISLTHVVFSSARVMRTLGMLGEVAGLAASLCCRFHCSTHQIYSEHLEELKKEMDQGVPIVPPNGFAPGFMELYHFMRPVGSVGNDNDENCWIIFDPQGNPRNPIPEPLKQNIKRLGSLHLEGKDGKWQDDEKN